MNFFRATLLIIFVCVSSNFSQTATLEFTLSLVQSTGGIQIPFQNGMPLPTFEKQNRIMVNFAGTWKKQRFNADENITLAKRDNTGLTNLNTEAQNRFKSSYDDSAWPITNLPSVENKMNTSPTPPELMPDVSGNDAVWYRRNFQVDAALSGKFAKLIFFAVNYVCDVWINDQYVGYHEGGYASFAFDVSSKLNYGGNNTIALRVHNIKWATRNDIVPYDNCDWFNYTGVIHDVYLEFSDPMTIVRTDIVPKDLDGNIQTSVVLLNKRKTSASVTASIKIYEAAINQTNITSEYAKDLIGSEASVTGSLTNSITVAADSYPVWRSTVQVVNPKLWSPSHPNLYVMKVTLTENGNVIDEYYTQFGIRIVTAQKGKFVLNDRILFMPGTARHEDHPTYGRSMPINVIYSDLTFIKNLNVTFLRTAHYPNHPYTYLIADRIGLAIMEEIPVYWFNSADAWNIQNNVRLIHQQMFREMVFRDYNRPSIVLWSTCNECTDVQNRLIYHNKIKDDLRTNYNDGRLLTQSAAANSPGSSDLSQVPLDVAGWTMYFGIFYPPNNPRNYFGQTYSFLNDARTNNPNKPLLDTEFGYWSSEDGSTEGQQQTVFSDTFNAFKLFTPYTESGAVNPNGVLMATTWWCAFDWYQNKNAGYQTMGLYKMDRQTAKQVANTLKTTYFPYASQEGIITDVKESTESRVPVDFRLDQNYPNPFNPSTVISYQIPVFSHVQLKIYDVLGKEVETLVNEFQHAGFYHYTFNTINSSLSSGVYFYTITAGDFVQTKKMILLK